VIVREANFINAFETPEFTAVVESAGRRKLIMSGLLTEGCVLGTALAALERGYEVYVAVDATAGETLQGQAARQAAPPDPHPAAPDTQARGIGA
jgi:nicotinamidase-related amidase